MDEIVMVSVLCGVMILFEIIPLLKNGKKRIAKVYMLLLSLAVTVFILANSGLVIPDVDVILNLVMGKK